MIGEVLRITIPSWMSRSEEAHWVDTMTRRYRRARQTDRIDLRDRAATLARRYDLPRPTDVRWGGEMRSRWGSCTPGTGTIRLNDRLAAFPAWVLDYVLVHELAHLAVADHSPAFWEIVRRYPRAERAIGYLMAKSGDHPTATGPTATCSTTCPTTCPRQVLTCWPACSTTPTHPRSATTSPLTIGRLWANACYRFAAPFLATIARGFDVSLAEIGVAITITEMLGLLAPLIGRGVDRLPRRVAMAAGLAGVAAAAAIAAAAPNIVVFTIGVMLLGPSKVVFDVGLRPWVTDHVEYERRGRVVGITETSWALASSSV